VDEEIKKGASFQSEKETRLPHSRTPKRKDAPVPENKVVSLEERAKDEQKPFLEQLLREGARKLLQAAIENEVLDYIQFHKDRLDENGQRLVVRNGHLPEREVISGAGPIPVRQPRVRHRDKGRFSSAILPKYMRRVPSVDALIPALYLKGISTGDFSEALTAILGEGASGLSATNIVRLKSSWETDYKAWSQRDLSAKRYVYWWADGVYFNVRLDEERSCVLVLIGATENGTKELLAVVDGYRESTQSWRELLGQLKRLGLAVAPKLAIGDGSLGFWIALQEEYGPIAQQRCWVHKTANILDKMPKNVQGKAKQLIHEMYLAPTRKAALRAYDQFISSYQIKFPKACECLHKDKEVLFTFYDFPAQHWPHIRTTNPIESTFATVRLRTHRTKGCGSRIATLTMVFKLGLEAQKHWRRLQGFELIPKVVTGVRFVDGEEQSQQAA
jgi:putative transposase